MTMLFIDLSVVVLDKLLRYVVMVMDERYVLAYSCVRIYMSKGTRFACRYKSKKGPIIGGDRVTYAIPVPGMGLRKEVFNTKRRTNDSAK